MIQKLAIGALALAAVCANAQDYTGQRIGNFDYVNGPNGYSGTGQQIGSFYYYNDNQGNSYTSQRIGNFEYGHWQPR